MNLQKIRANLRQNWKEMGPKIKVTLSIFLFVFVFLVIIFSDRIFINIYPGEAGVLWRRFDGVKHQAGTDMQQVYGEGFHIIWPWDKMYVYNVRIQQVIHHFVALSNDGLAIDFDLSIRYRPRVEELPLLHREIGPNYVEKIVQPEVQSEVRSIVGKFTPDEIYTSQGFIIETILQGTLLALYDRYVVLDDLLIKEVRLPERVREAIENKLRAEQMALEWDYRIVREIKEAQRKEIEGVGVQRFQEEAMSDVARFNDYLRYRGIDATVQLATSNNAKVVVVGNRDGLPLILNMADSGQLNPAKPTDQYSAPPSVSETDLSQDDPEQTRINREKQPTEQAMPKVAVPAAPSFDEAETLYPRVMRNAENPLAPMPEQQDSKRDPSK
ncbi:MAG: prohibitin family protein [Verrucomicrobiota bacterium JB022]|nr:prohibitin family protein [Verrucomicrobiota bacterium JB022]